MTWTHLRKARRFAHYLGRLPFREAKILCDLGAKRSGGELTAEESIEYNRLMDEFKQLKSGKF
jgi:hypothetical protein